MNKANRYKGKAGAFAQVKTVARHFPGAFPYAKILYVVAVQCKEGSTVPRGFQTFWKRDESSCRFITYRQTESSRPREQGSTPNSAPHYQNEAKKLPLSSNADQGFNQFSDPKSIKQILPIMAANVQTLTTQEAKGRQVHLLCQTLITLLREGQQ